MESPPQVDLTNMENLRKEAGAAAVEYAVLVSFFVFAVLGTTNQLGESARDNFCHLTNKSVDFDKNGDTGDSFFVWTSDHLYFKQAQKRKDPRADLNCDGKYDDEDLLRFVELHDGRPGGLALGFTLGS